jgi:DNA-binding MarR family transcriptional regulator
MTTEKAERKKILLGLNERTFFRFSLLSRLLFRRLTEIYVAKYGRPSDAWRVIMIVGSERTTSPSVVAKMSGMEPDKISRLTDYLFQQDMITRVQGHADRRRVALSLTKKGKKIYDEIEEIRAQIEIEFLEELGSKELAAFYRTLEKLEKRAQIVLGNRRPASSLREADAIGGSRIGRRRASA